MTKGLTTDQKAAVAADEVKTRVLLTIHLNNPDEEVIRILENDTLEMLEINNNVYIGGMVKRSDVNTQTEGAVESCNITISNINQGISSVIINEGDVLTGAECVIEEVIYDADDNILDDPVEIFRGKVNNIHLTHAVFTFDVERSLGGYSSEAPMTTYDVSCQWMFKDERCQYSGGLTYCDKTMTSCQARGNEKRFGGYPSIPVEMSRRS